MGHFNLEEQLQTHQETMTFDLKNKICIITGASGGIGCTTAIEFARAGAVLCLTGRKTEKLQETKEKCISAGLSDEKVLTVTADVTRQPDVQMIIDETIKKFQRIDVLVNNAATAVFRDFENTDLELMEHMYNSNANSVFMMSKEVLPHLIKSQGNIVNISSIGGTKPLPYYFAYSTSKASVNHMTQLMALDLGRKGIRVNCVNPGTTRTDVFIKPGGNMTGKPELIEEYFKSAAKANPMLRVGKPEEVARTILFLASEAASFINGAIIPVDGGRHATCLSPPIDPTS